MQVNGQIAMPSFYQLGVTIDLERSVARLSVAPRNFSELTLIAEMEKAIVFCSTAFNNADAERLGACFDPEFALSSPRGELHGRDQAVNYFQQYFSLTPRAHLSMKMSDQRAVGEFVWTLYDYTIEAPSKHTFGRGIMLCRKSGNLWYILSMHESPIVTAVIPKP